MKVSFFPGFLNVFWRVYEILQSCVRLSVFASLIFTQDVAANTLRERGRARKSTCADTGSANSLAPYWISTLMRNTRLSQLEYYVGNLRETKVKAGT